MFNYFYKININRYLCYFCNKKTSDQDKRTYEKIRYSEDY